MISARKLLVVAPALLWLLFAVLMVQDWVRDPYNPALLSTAAYGHNQDGALSRGIIWSAVELSVLYAVLRPWSYSGSWIRALSAWALFLPWALLNGIASMHSGGVLILHSLWLVTIVAVLFLTFVASALQAAARSLRARAAAQQAPEADGARPRG